jgi:F-type H+-transporting ATPase subunit epsilon
MAATLKLEIVTPQGTAFSEDVEMVTVPGADGEFGVYPNHLRLIAQVEPGELVIIQNGETRSLAVGEGFAEVTETKVSILTDMAIAAEKIDEAMVQEARDRAEARLKEKLSDEEIAAVNASLVRSVAQLQVKRRRRG